MNSDSLIDIEKIVLYQVAQNVIENLPEEERRKVLEASLTKTLDNILRPWNVQNVIEKDVNRYMMEYLKRPDVQDRIKEATEKTVDKLMDGVISVIITSAQDSIKSNYKNFIAKKDC